MRSSSLSSMGFKKVDSKRSNNTAYYIFPHSDGRAPLHPFSVSNTHFIKRPGSKRGLLVTDGSEGDMKRIADLMVPTLGTIWDMVEYFVQGAQIKFADPKVALEIYKRINDHFNHHALQARSQMHYQPPPMDEMQYLSEFAMGIRHIAVEADPDLDQDKKPTLAHGWYANRVSFTRVEETAQRKPEYELATAARKLDAIQAYLASIGMEV